MSDNTEEIKQDLKEILHVGLTVQSIAVTVTYALKNNKKEFLEKLNNVIAEFNQSLNDAERNDLKNEINLMIEKKSEELLKELSLELSENELDQAVQFLKDSVGLPLE